MSRMFDVPAVLLVGGLGTRLRPVLPSTPKALASVGDKSFLELIVCQLRNQGMRRLVMCTGYLADSVETLFGDGSKWEVVIEYSRERNALGTAGALKLAQPYLQETPHFLVMNGDSFVEIDFAELINLHRGSDALASMAVRQVEDASRYGTVHISAGGRVTGFAEKNGAHIPGLINAGVYVFDRTIFEYLPEGPASLERDVFPRILRRGVFALEQRGMFIDIGTPEDYARARSVYDQLYAAALRTSQHKARP